MKTRILSAVVGMIIAMFAVWQFNTPILNLFGMIIYTIALYEILKAFNKGNSIFIGVPLLFVGIAVIFNSYLTFPPMFVGVILAISLVVVIVFDFENIQFTVISSTIVFALFVLFGLYSILRLRTVLPFSIYGWDAAFLFVLCAAIAWGGDVMAYFSGYFFGKHKLAPKLSPKKTIEGAIGGVLGSVIFAVLMLFAYSQIKSIVEIRNVDYAITATKYVVLAIIAALGSGIGMLGDLFASAIKRQCGIKDYGYIMPGHGGVLDRFDSILLVAPFISFMADYLASIGGVL